MSPTELLRALDALVTELLLAGPGISQLPDAVETLATQLQTAATTATALAPLAQSLDALRTSTDRSSRTTALLLLSSQVNLVRYALARPLEKSGSLQPVPRSLPLDTPLSAALLEALRDLVSRALANDYLAGVDLPRLMRTSLKPDLRLHPMWLASLDHPTVGPLAAIYGIAPIGNSVVPELEQALKDRMPFALTALAHLDPPRLEPFVQEILSRNPHEAGPLLHAAIWSLTAYESDQAFEQLFAHYRAISDPSSVAVWTAMQALPHSRHPQRDAKIRDEYLRTVTEASNAPADAPTATWRSDIGSVLLALDRLDHVPDRWLATLNSLKVPGYRYHAASMLIQCATPALIEQLSKDLESPEPGPAMLALCAGFSLGQPWLCKQVAHWFAPEKLRSEIPSRVETLLWILGMYTGPSVLPDFYPMVRNVVLSARTQDAKTALLHAVAILTRVKDRSVETVRALADAMQHWRTMDATVTQMLFEGLVKLDTPAASAVFASLLAMEGGSVIPVEMLAPGYAALKRNDDATHTSAIQKRLEGTVSEAERALAAPVLKHLSRKRRKVAEG